MAPVDITDIASKLDISKPENLVLVFIAEKTCSLADDVKEIKDSQGKTKQCEQDHESRLKVLEKNKTMCDTPNGCPSVVRLQKLVYWLFGILFSVQTGTIIAIFTTLAKLLP